MKREVELGCRSKMDCLAAELFSTTVCVDSRLCGQLFVWTAVCVDTVFVTVFPTAVETLRWSTQVPLHLQVAHHRLSIVPMVVERGFRCTYERT